MKKKIIIVAAIAIAMIVIVCMFFIGVEIYRLFIEVEYTGSFSFSLDGNEYDWPLEQVYWRHVDDGTIFTTEYSEGRNSIGIVFKIWEEDGEPHIRLECPKLQLDGESYYMTRGIRNSDYTIEALDSDIIWITFWGMPFDDGIHLHGRFIFQVTNTEFY